MWNTLLFWGAFQKSELTVGADHSRSSHFDNEIGRLRKQPSFCDVIAVFPAKWRLRNSMLMTRHNPDLGFTSDWSCSVGNLLQPIRSTTQIWVVTRHQYGSCALVSRRYFAGKPVVTSRNVGCFLRLWNRLFSKSFCWKTISFRAYYLVLDWSCSKTVHSPLFFPLGAAILVS